ncbi:hypothetical protein AB833_04895 [Chromatiales bacterium (ex Bugula neritina AB1)]|nr:hypothetical protein AB833_04895 [Chromatiales bacterium (ex Bugula neritina AB1)]
MAEPGRELLQQATRHLMQHPLTCAEQEPELFAVIRRHEQTLDRWFTQRLGYRLQVTTTTARLYKATVVPHRPRLIAPVGSKRTMSQRECTLLVLTLAAVAAGPRIISLRDLIDDVRSQATEAEITLTNEPVERRAQVTALRWMVVHGLARELHETIDRYEHDDSADAILEIDFDRISLLPLPALGRARSAAELIDRSDRRSTSLRQWMRARLAEDPVLYHSDLTEPEWSQLRRRVGEEVAFLDEMFDLHLEVRAEGMAAIDSRGQLSDRPFPLTGTIGHAALVFIAWLIEQPQRCCSHADALQSITQACQQFQRHWSKARVENPFSLLTEVTALLADLRLLDCTDEQYYLQPAAARYRMNLTLHDSAESPADANDNEPAQGALW